MKESILITPRSVTRKGHPALKRLREAGYDMVFCRAGEVPKEDDLISLLPGCVGYLAGVEPISAAALKGAPSLRVISRNGTGVDGIDLEAARHQGIRILRADGANARGVAELTFALMLDLSRSIIGSDRVIKSGGWERFPGFELEGKTLGIIGCGKIGQMVARFAHGFGMHVLGADVLLTDSQVPEELNVVDLKKLLQEADIITLHCPPLPLGQPLLDALALTETKKGVIIINTARGSLIDTTAMLDALRSGQVAALAIDAHDQEPPADRRLAAHPKVVATPHIGGYTLESIDRAMGLAVDNLLKALREA